MGTNREMIAVGHSRTKSVDIPQGRWEFSTFEHREDLSGCLGELGLDISIEMTFANVCFSRI
jgi:hypothetical protein